MGRLGLVIVLLAWCGAAPSHAQGADPAGTWLTQAGDARVRVSKCGGGICGAVTWLREPTDPATGQPQRDSKNPNPALAKRPIVGLVLFQNMQPSGTARWSGTIYNADDGQTYASNIAMTGPDTLRVEGCLGALCGAEVWTRSR
ncbi:MAG: DUF2147 domain-containing protein [Proteobacteria bacterium]|nr:MAG: DUF2147 domain-containing protein [Pseudomonadota bacterium]